MKYNVRFTDIHSSPKETQPSRTGVSFEEECMLILKFAFWTLFKDPHIQKIICSLFLDIRNLRELLGQKIDLERSFHVDQINKAQNANLKIFMIQ